MGTTMGALGGIGLVGTGGAQSAVALSLELEAAI
jgi:hypothetical protein